MNIKHSILLLIFIFLYTRASFSQPWYFNNVYNPNGTWASGMSIIETENGYIGCAISSDSISDYFYNTSTFIINPYGEMITWKNYGKDGCDFWPGDEGGLSENNNSFGLFGTVDDYLTGSIYGLFYKIDEFGDTMFTEKFTSENDTIFVGRACIPTTEGGFALLGNISGNEASKDIILIKTDFNGIETWRNQYGTDSVDWAKSIIQTPDKGYAIGSWTRIPGIYSVIADPIVFKTDSLGVLEWSINLGGPFMDDNAMICSTSDSCIMVLTAYADSMWTPEYAYARINLIKLDMEGNVIWNKKYGPSKPVNFISNIIQLENGDYLACGWSRFSIYLPAAGWLFRFNSDGDSLWYRDYFYYPEDPVYGINYLYDVSQTEDNGFVAVGQAHTIYPPNNVQKMWVLKVDSVGCEIENCWLGIEEQGGGEAGQQGGREAGRHGDLVIWPNPARDIVDCRWSNFDGRGEVTLMIYDIFGLTILSLPRLGEGQGGGRSWQIDVSSLPPGIYIAIVQDGNTVLESAKFVVVR